MAERKRGSKAKTEENAEATTNETTNETAEETGTEETMATENLIAIAEDLNTVLGLDPAIPTEGDEETIKNAIATAGAECLPADEKDLAPETWAFLKDNEMLTNEAFKAAPAPAPANKRVPPTPPKRYTRFEAMIDAIKAGETDEAKLVAKADELYVANGGKSNTDLVKQELDWSVKILTSLGYATSEGGKLELKKV